MSKVTKLHKQRRVQKESKYRRRLLNRTKSIELRRAQGGRELRTRPTIDWMRPEHLHDFFQMLFENNARTIATATATAFCIPAKELAGQDFVAGGTTYKSNVRMT